MRSKDQSTRPQLVDRDASVSGSTPDGSLDKLRRLSLFAGVSEQAHIQLAAKAHWREYTANEIVVDAGDLSDEVFFIIEGAVRVVVRTLFGYEAILNELSAGEFFGELSAIDGSQRSANVTALQRTRLWVVPSAAFMELALSDRDVGLRLLRLLSARLRIKDERLLEFSVLSVRQRLIAELLRLSRDRGGGERVLSPPPPQHVLAARIGTRRESVSRELTEMSRAGLLTIGQRSIVLHSPERLRSELDVLTRNRRRPDNFIAAD
jgi:CRP/FNR family cyclic AMP-dependent transcriptional regulator